MKIKRDFVTNSSSTSFIVWGAQIEIEKITENEVLLNKTFDYLKKKTYTDPNITFDKFTKSDVIYEIEDFLQSKEIDLSVNIGDSYLSIGLSPDVMQDNQTLLDFKQEIVSSLKEVGINIISNDVEFISECSFDG